MGLWYFKVQHAQREQLMTRKQVEPTVLALLQDETYLYDKIINQSYSASRLAKELGTTRTTVQKYCDKFQIKPILSQKELSTLTTTSKSPEQKKHILHKRQTTNIEKYGAENTFQSHRDKIEEVMIEKYGVKSALQHTEILEKQKATMLELYGEEHAMHVQSIKQRVLNTQTDRYGGNPLSNPQVRQQISITTLQRYGVEYAMSNPTVAAYAKLMFNKLYNTPEHQNSILNKSKETCLSRYGVLFHSQKHISSDILDNLNNKTWLIDQHHTNKKTLSQIATECGISDTTTIHRYLNKHDIQIKYYFESAQQRELSDWLTSQNIIVDTNVRSLIPNQELDIFLPEHNVAIEYCGVFWHCDYHPRMTSKYHLSKLQACQKQNIRLITMYEDEWLHNKDLVKNKLLNILGKDVVATYARKCSIVEVNKTNKKQFFDNYHIQGDGPGSITYGLCYNNQVVAMMTFIKQLHGRFILNRFASNGRVVGGFQKLLKHFTLTVDWAEIVSFADSRWSEGKVYDKSNFTLDNTLLPDYRYVIGNKTYHKFGFRRKYLPRFLPTFDQSLTEVENMRNAGYYRIWNCGLLRYVMINNIDDVT